MSAELLRRAAALMRERAEAAMPGPWSWDLSQDRCWALVMHNDPARDPRPIASSSDDDDAEHIASWHPVVALAVADWLEAAAQDREDQPYLPQWWDELPLAVARAYLNEEA